MKKNTVIEDLYVVRTLPLMMHLVRLNYDVVNVEDSDENPKYKVFLFRRSKNLENDIRKYVSNLKKAR